MTEARIRGIAECTTIHRGVPPANCAMGCPEYLSIDICATCYRRPVKSVEHVRTPVTYRKGPDGNPIDIQEEK